MDTTTTRNPNAPPDTPRVHCLSPSFGLRVRRGSDSAAPRKSTEMPLGGVLCAATSDNGSAVTSAQGQFRPEGKSSGGIRLSVYPERNPINASRALLGLRHGEDAPGAGGGGGQWVGLGAEEGAESPGTHRARGVCRDRDAGCTVGGARESGDGSQHTQARSLVTAGFAVMAAGPGGAWAGRFFGLAATADPTPKAYDAVSVRGLPPCPGSDQRAAVALHSSASPSFLVGWRGSWRLPPRPPAFICCAPRPRPHNPSQPIPSTVTAHSHQNVTAAEVPSPGRRESSPPRTSSPGRGRHHLVEVI